MSSAADHDTVSELLGAYALDAVDPDEAQLVEDHLRECPRCRDEVRQHQEVAAQLAFVGEAAPEGLWARIAADLAPSEPEPDLGRLYPLRRARSANPWLVRVVLPSVAAVLVVLVGALGWEVHTQANRVQRMTTAFNATTSMDQAVQTALADPAATKFSLTSADGRIHVGGLLQADGTGYLLEGSHAALPTLPSSETYQLWGITGTQQISLGLLGPHPKVVAFRTSAAQIDEIAITAERAGGVVQPTHAPVVAGHVPAAPAV